MADINNNQSKVFGGVQFDKDITGIENTSYFDGINNDNLYSFDSKKNTENLYDNKTVGNGSIYSTNSNIVGNGNVYGNSVNFGNNGVYGTVDNTGNYGRAISNAGSYNGTLGNNVDFEPIPQEKAIAKQGIWSKIKAFLFQEIDLNAPIVVELTPYQQKVENEINEFLHQEVSFKRIANLFKGKK